MTKGKGVVPSASALQFGALLRKSQGFPRAAIQITSPFRRQTRLLFLFHSACPLFPPAVASLYRTCYTCFLSLSRVFFPSHAFSLPSHAFSLPSHASASRLTYPLFPLTRPLSPLFCALPGSWFLVNLPPRRRAGRQIKRRHGSMSECPSTSADLKKKTRRALTETEVS